MMSVFIGALVVSIFLFGSAIGSFLLVVADRYMARKSWLTGRSRCDFCGHQLTWVDLIPYVSYTASFGKCRHCKKELPVQYPIFEFISGLLSVGILVPVLLAGGDVVHALLMYASACIVLVLVRIDGVRMILPDVFIAALAICAIGIAYVTKTTPDDIILGVLAGSGFLYFLWILTGGAGIGFGDVKLMVPFGIMFGLQGAVTLLFVSFFIGGLVGIFLLVTKKASGKTAIPFGPFLAAAACVLMVFPELSHRFFLLLGVY